MNHRYMRAIAANAGIAKVDDDVEAIYSVRLSSYNSVYSGAPKVKTLRELVVGISNSTPPR